MYFQWDVLHVQKVLENYSPSSQRLFMMREEDETLGLGSMVRELSPCL